MKLQLKFGLILSTISILSYVSFANAETKVIASIKPLHSLVSYVMDGVGKPGILVDGSSSPHTFQLKPSHAEMLQEADIVFWIGEDLESFLESPLESIATNSKHIALMESDEIELLKFREKNIFGDHDDHDDHADEHGDDHDEHDDHADGHGDHGDHGFEWAGVFDLTEGTYNWSFAKVGGEYADPAMKMVILMSDEIESSEERAEELLESSSSTDRNHSSTLSANDSAFMLNLTKVGKLQFLALRLKKLENMHSSQSICHLSLKLMNTFSRIYLVTMSNLLLKSQTLDIMIIITDMRMENLIFTFGLILKLQKQL